MKHATAKRLQGIQAYYESARAYAERNPGTPAWIARSAARRLRLALWVLGRAKEARTIALLALALLACACNTGHHTIVVRDGDLTPAVVAAVDAWNTKLEAQCPNVSLTLVEGEADINVRWGRVGIPEALATEKAGTITVNQKMAELWDARAVGALMHEIGHALGADHSTDRADVMYPLADPRVPELTTHDVWSVCRNFDGVP